MEIFFFLLIFAALLGYAAWNKHRQMTVWQQVAGQLGLAFMNGGWFGSSAMSGSYKGVDIAVKSVVRGSGKNKKVYTVVEASLHALTPLSLEVYEEGIFQMMGKMIGGEDIQVGDHELDETFVIKGVDDAEITDLLTTPRVKSALLTGHQVCSSLRIQPGNARLRERGRTTNPDKLRKYIDTVVGVAKAINETCEQRPNPAAKPSPQAQPSPPGPTSPAPFGPPPQARNAQPPDESPAQPAAEPAAAVPSGAETEEDDWW